MERHKTNRKAGTLMHDTKHALLTLEQACEELHISCATGKNWVRLNKLTVDHWEGDTPLFSCTHIALLKNALQTGSHTALQSRRNKTYVQGSTIHTSYETHCTAKQELHALLDTIELHRETLDQQKISQDLLLSACLAECALQLLHFAQGIAVKTDCDRNTSFLETYLTSHNTPALLQKLLAPILARKKEKLLSLLKQIPDLFSISYQYRPGEDLLGLIYQSVQSLHHRKKNGAYYTPDHIRKQMVEQLLQANSETKKYLDPACGTGGFLLALTTHVPINQLYGYDIDALSIALARINLVLATGCTDWELLHSHFEKKDFLTQDPVPFYNCILGNPPWGATFSKTEQNFLRAHYTCLTKGTLEIYDLFVEQAISCLKEHGTLYFVLPEAFLQVKKHEAVRERICETCSLSYLEYLGDIFPGVQCPSILFQLEKTPDASHNPTTLSCLHANIKTEQDCFSIETERSITAGNFSIRSNDAIYKMLRQMEEGQHIVYLKDHADFALGIVTGDNHGLLSDTQLNGMSPILSGKEVLPYEVLPARKYVHFQRDLFQQCAPLAFYQAPEKLVYRFIAPYPVFALDTEQHFTLNSCNILIPQIDDLSIYYLLAVLNSSSIRRYYEYTFHSVKILRSHLEQLPIPVPTDQEQDEIVALVKKVLACNAPEKKAKWIAQIDEKIGELYQTK